MPPLAALLRSGKVALVVAVGVALSEIAADPDHALTKAGAVRIAAACAVAVWQALTHPAVGAAGPSDGDRVNAVLGTEVPHD
jgi:hypothetical protein